MFTIRDTEYNDSYLTVDVAMGGIEFTFVDGPEEEDTLAVVINPSQLKQIVNILEDATARSVGNYVKLPQVSETEELDVCNLRSFGEYMITLESAGLGISMTPDDKQLLVAYIVDYLGE
ncbi:hypothetical protein BPS13_0040 [Bacillus phage BPS13]|uniref:Uncharacterized protein n=2 Tax=Wphvirus BPS13 TaxID=1987727 RepID=A0A173GBP2_9CAUD|nr:hypothetical protein BPS13_0040 [Bacillus phage BPS13]YP_009281988.1 hypothetical protein SALINJAH_34 [Bacillus phage SalinJah]AEZ50219.1 hypothetical protein BPS13_0040 [Bacillus phage BPS13]ANH50680.1 hypothetical protein SALINJAH_34 [Bacillus phage SalinJah]